jgi:hypothetical protein
MSRVLAMFFALFASVYCLECDRDSDCFSVSNHVTYVSCLDGFCECLTENGFTGNATFEDKCSCPFSVYGGNGGPYCKQCDPPRQIEYDNTGIPRCLNKAECEDKLITKYNRMILPRLT